MIKAGFYVDGFTLKRINDYYMSLPVNRRRVNIPFLETFVRHEIFRRLDLKNPPEISIDKHFYHQNSNPMDERVPEDARRRILKFEKYLHKVGYDVFYSPDPPTMPPSANLWLYAHALNAAKSGEVNMVILLSTQGQHAGLFRTLREMRIPTLLIGWEKRCTNSRGELARWQTDKMLKSYASAYTPLERKHPLSGELFEAYPH